MVWSTQKEKIKKLSERIVDAQRPIRILDAIKWDSSIEEELRKSKFKEAYLSYLDTNMSAFHPKLQTMLKIYFDNDTLKAVD